MFSLNEFPEIFLRDVLRCATIFKEYQEQAILRNLMLYNMPPEDTDLETIKKRISDHYMQKYGLKRIPRNNRIVRAQRKCAFLEFELGHIKRSDSFQIPTGREHLHSLQSELKEIDSHLKNLERIEWVNPEKKNWRQQLCYIHGKDYNRLQNTRFCHTRTFRIFQSLHEVSMKRQCIPSRVDDMLLQEKQNLLLEIFLEATSTIGEKGYFELKEIPILSRFSVSTVWIISLLFDKVFILTYFLLASF